MPLNPGRTEFYTLPDPLQQHGAIRMACHQWGSPNHGRVAICLHGLTRNGQDFAVLAEDLSHTHWVLAPDMPGRGQSDWLQDPAAYSYPYYLLLIEHWLTELGITSVDWIGTSMGGLIGMMLSATNPKRIHKLVLNDVGPFVPADALSGIGQYVGREPTFPDAEAALRYLKVRLRDFGIPPQDDCWQHLQRHAFQIGEGGMLRLAYDPAIAKPFQEADGTPKQMEDVNLWPLWAEITCPVMVIRGERSGLLTKEIVRHMSQHRPRLQSVEVPNAGHAPALMTSHERDAILRFILTSSQDG